MVTLLLASRSPRRRELLSLLGIPFKVVTPHVQEDIVSGEDARDAALRLASVKAESVARIEQGKTIVAADTVVVLHAQVMGKPVDRAAASAMLGALRGREHQVISGLAVVDPAKQSLTVRGITTRVRMRNYRDEEVAEYTARGEPFDKAGGYAIQDRIFRPAARFEGCYANVMGLPLCHLYLRLNEMGFPLLTSPLQACEAYIGQPCLAAAQILRQDNH